MLRRVRPVLAACAVAAMFFALGDRAGPWLDRPGREMPAEARTRQTDKPMGVARLRLAHLPGPVAAARPTKNSELVPLLRLSPVSDPAAPAPLPHSLAAVSAPVLRPRAEPVRPDLGPAPAEPEATPVKLEPSPTDPGPAALSTEPPAAALPAPKPKDPGADAKPSTHTGTDPNSNVDFYEVNNLPEAEGEAVDAPQAGQDVNMIDDPGLVPKASPDDSAGQDAPDTVTPDKPPADNDSSMTSTDN